MSDTKDIIENENIEDSKAQEAEQVNDAQTDESSLKNEDNEDIIGTGKEESDDAKWYVVHTYSGYENKVKVNLEKSIENQGLEDLIYEIFKALIFNGFFQDMLW